MNKLEQAARALLAKWDAHPYTPWREVGFISGDVANLRKALTEQERKAKYDERFERLEKFEQAEQEPLVRFCPGCGSIGEVDSKYRDCCPDGIKARIVPSRFAEECQGLFNLAIGNVAPVQEPVGYVDEALRIKWLIDYDAVSKLTGHKLYAAPVRTKDLNDDELDVFFNMYWQGKDDADVDLIEVFRAVIQKYKEKNK